MAFAWLKTSLCKEKLEVMIHEERECAVKTEGMWEKGNNSLIS